jgi:carboxymethylenebutenolidase
MCDDVIHQGAAGAGLSRRTFAAAAAAAAAAPARTLAQSLVIEKDVLVPTADGSADAALFHPPQGRWPAVLIWTDILGLRPVFRDMGRRLAAAGYVVIVPNPYYRLRRGVVVDGAFDFNKPEDRAKVFPLAASLTPATTQTDAEALIAFLDAQPQTLAAAKAGVQGYCMGGPLTFRSAAAAPRRFAAAATFHGGGLVTSAPTSPHLLIPKMEAEVYCAVADNDDRRDPEAKTTLRQAFAAADRPARVEVYAGADHGWCVQGSAVYNQAAAERAWSELLALYKRILV